jgi:hypothetical protein
VAIFVVAWLRQRTGNVDHLRTVVSFVAAFRFVVEASTNPAGAAPPMRDFKKPDWNLSMKTASGWIAHDNGSDVGISLIGRNEGSVLILAQDQI